MCPWKPPGFCAVKDTEFRASLKFFPSRVEGVLFDKAMAVLFECPERRAGTYVIPNSVTNIGYPSFRGCTSLTSIEVGALNSDYSSVEGVLFNKAQSTLVAYPGGKARTYTIPAGVISVGRNAFDHNTGLARPLAGRTGVRPGP